jgi:hypothetical protein
MKLRALSAAEGSLRLFVQEIQRIGAALNAAQ